MSIGVNWGVDGVPQWLLLDWILLEIPSPPGLFFLAGLRMYRWLGRLGDIGDRPRASLSSWAGSVLLAGCPRVALSSWAGS
ncbi:hypothetical protein KY289_028177 [Solanum tuberosum]|nr:hypothetical protein KY289_028177 [Solanum tuberosum]